MMFFPDDAKLCSKMSLSQPNRTSIYKLTSKKLQVQKEGEEKEEEEEEKEEEKEAQLASLSRAWNS